MAASLDILLVEDNPRDAEMTLRALRKGGVDPAGILWVKDGVQALDYIGATGIYSGRAAGQPKVVLLDLKLPRIDGFEVLNSYIVKPVEYDSFVEAVCRAGVYWTRSNQLPYTT